MEKHQRVKKLGAGSCITNERGVAIIAALLILMLLSFVAITSTTTVTTEKRMVRSQIVFEENFYLAESAALEGIQKLDNQPKTQLDELLASETVNGTSDNFNLLTYVDVRDILNDISILDVADNDDEITQADLDGMADISDLNAQTHRFVAQTQGAGSTPNSTTTAAGGSLVKGSGGHPSGSGQVYDYMSYGITNQYNGRSIIKIGYKRVVVEE